MALKQVNWGALFLRNSKGSLDADSTFATYDDMIKNTKIYNGAIVSVTSDAAESRNGIYLIRGDDEQGKYSFIKGNSGDLGGLPVLLGNNALVANVSYLSSDGTYKVVLTDSIFESDDIIGWSMNDSLTAGTYSVVELAADKTIYIKKGYNIPALGDILYHIGNRTIPSRLIFGAIFLRDGVPMQGVFVNSDLNNINKKFHSGITLGNGGSPQLYSENSLLKGVFFDEANRNLSEEIDKTNLSVLTYADELRDEFSSNNLINNPYFLEKLLYWSTENIAKFFLNKKDGKWLWVLNFNLTLNGIYSTKKQGAYINTFDNKSCLSIQEGFVKQEAENLKTIISSSETEYPVYVNLHFVCWVVSAGTLTIELGTSTVTYNLSSTSKWVLIKALLQWNGEDGLKISFISGKSLHAELKIRGIILEIDDMESLKKKYEKLFSYSGILVEMAEKYNETSSQ